MKGSLGWLVLERMWVRTLYLGVTVVAAARLDPASLAVALAANAIVVLPQSFGDQSVNGLVLRRATLTGDGARLIRRTATIIGASLAAVTAVLSLPVQNFTGIPGLAPVGAVLATIIPLATHAGVSTAILQRAGRQRSASASRGLASAVSICIWLPLMIHTGSAWSLVGFYLTTDLLAAISLWALSRSALEAAPSEASEHLGLREVIRFMAAVGPANCLNWLSLQGFGLLCARGMSVPDYAELALYLSILRVGLDLIAGPSQVNLQVGLGRERQASVQDDLIVRTSNRLTAAVLMAIVAGLIIDPHRVLGWIGKEEFHSVLLFWLLASLPLQATSWLDRPVLIQRHRERTDLHMRGWLAAVDSVIALSSHALGLAGLGAAITVRYLVSRLALDIWFGGDAPHCRLRQAWPALAFALLGGIGILAGVGRLTMIVVGASLAAVMIIGEVSRGWHLSWSMRATPEDL